jgi:hypothetical protein
VPVTLTRIVGLPFDSETVADKQIPGTLLAHGIEDHFTGVDAVGLKKYLTVIANRSAWEMRGPTRAGDQTLRDSQAT